MSTYTLKQRLTLAARVLLKGYVSNVSEDEQVKFLFSDLRSIPDESDTPRLNVLVPSLSIKSTFGGVSTLIELPLMVHLQHLKAAGWRMRYICLGPRIQDDSDNVAIKYLRRHSVNDVTIEYTSEGPTKVGAKDLFMGSMWQHFYDSEPLRARVKELSGVSRPYVSMIQDYEAGFFPWSSAYMLAQSLYAQENQVIVVNSLELANFYQQQGHPTSKGMSAFAPVMNDRLREILFKAPTPPKKKQILYYGRPNDRRNCFHLVKTAIERWSHEHPNAKDWEVISVGAEHSPLSLSSGVRQRVLGKLTLDEYGQRLHEASVGMSLMASPHPSYPPLEMAYFGAITLTNNFAGKDLSAWHGNFRCLTDLSPAHLAQQLAQACATVETNPEIGRQTPPGKREYLEPFPASTLEGIGLMIQRAIY
jgi:O-antigen biosynthesis protein